MKRYQFAAVLMFILLTGVLLACTGSNDAQGMSGSAAQGLSGKVVETMDSGPYTYVQIENQGAKTWVAVPQTKIEVGQEVSFQPGAEMRNFTSKTLNRTFEIIYFSGGVIK